MHNVLARLEINFQVHATTPESCMIRAVQRLLVLVTLAEDIEVHVPDIAARQELELTVVDTRKDYDGGSRLFDVDGDY